MSGRTFIARHGETVFNAAGRMQGEALHTPLTRAGFVQAEEMGAALRRALGPKPPLTLWASTAGRALQTLAIVAEHLELDWHAARTDPRLGEIGMGEWGGRLYRELAAEQGEDWFDPAHGIFTIVAPGGEGYDEMAVRLRAWLADTAHDEGDRLIVMHGMSSRVLRGLMTGAADHPGCGAPIAAGLPQGSVVAIEAGIERLVHVGGGGGGRAA
ncbi:MAG: histidine phosphatase family protein [Allosphingosinicella sp.]